MQYTYDQDPGFIDPKVTDSSPLIKVVGVGGGGGNAVNHLFGKEVEDITFGIINTDGRALNQSAIPDKIVMGGLGAGDRPEVARQAAEACSSQIERMLSDGTRMVFITASMGGGTGTGAAPVVAKIAKELGILTVGIVNVPFAFEGRNKMKQALEGVKAMQANVDTLIVINNQRLIDNYGDLPMQQCFAVADEVLAQAAQAISHLISVDGYWNIDFNDVNTILKDGRSAIISEGVGQGEHRVTKALHAALDSPLLRNREIYEATRILINIYCNPDVDNPLVAREVQELEEFKYRFKQEGRSITGWCFDRTMGEEVRITILASGFELNVDDEGESDIILFNNDDDDELLQSLEQPTYQRHRTLTQASPVPKNRNISFD